MLQRREVSARTWHTDRRHGAVRSASNDLPCLVYGKMCAVPCIKADRKAVSSAHISLVRVFSGASAHGGQYNQGHAIYRLSSAVSRVVRKITFLQPAVRPASRQENRGGRQAERERRQADREGWQADGEGTTPDRFILSGKHRRSAERPAG